MELYSRVRRARHVEGMSIREPARVFGLHRDTVREMLMFSLPPGYRRSGPAARLRLYSPTMGAMLSCELCLIRPRLELPLTPDRRVSRPRPAGARRTARLAGLCEC